MAQIGITLAPTLTVGLTLSSGGSEVVLDGAVPNGLLHTLTLAPAGPVVLATAGEILRGERGLRGEQGLPGPAGTSGTVIYTAGMALSGHVAVTLDALGRAVPADCTMATHAHAVVGVTLGAAAAGESVSVLAPGQLEHAGWAFVPGQCIFLGLDGALTQALPVQALFAKVLGIAVAPTRVNLGFQAAIFV